MFILVGYFLQVFYRLLENDFFTFNLWKIGKPIIAPGLSNAGVVNLEKGKIPPQAIDLEEAVLGAMLIDKRGGRGHRYPSRRRFL